jgi:hypothetical protein
LDIFCLEVPKNRKLEVNEPQMPIKNQQKFKMKSDEMNSPLERLK